MSPSWQHGISPITVLSAHVPQSESASAFGINKATALLPGTVLKHSGAVILHLKVVEGQHGLVISDTDFIVHIGRYNEDLCFHTLFKKYLSVKSLVQTALQYT